jgi:hypothetical protein
MNQSLTNKMADGGRYHGVIEHTERTAGGTAAGLAATGMGFGMSQKLTPLLVGVVEVPFGDFRALRPEDHVIGEPVPDVIDQVVFFPRADL